MKKTIKKWVPDKGKVKEYPFIHFFGDRIHDPSLWHVNRRSISLAVFIGLFCAWLPMPFQTVFAITAAFFLRCNIPLSAALIWLTNPLTIPPMFYLGYRVGAFFTGHPVVDLGDAEMSVDWFMEEIKVIWYPLLIGSLICGFVMACCGYATVQYFWRMSIIRRWKERKQRHKS